MKWTLVWKVCPVPVLLSDFYQTLKRAGQELFDDTLGKCWPIKVKTAVGKRAGLKETPSSKTFMERNLLVKVRRYKWTPFRLKITQIYFQKWSDFEIPIKKKKSSEMKINHFSWPKLFLFFGLQQSRHFQDWLLIPIQNSKVFEALKPESFSALTSLLGAH